MRFAVLSSGSRANSTYVEAGGMRLLIDCGLSARETERRLFSNGLRPEEIDAIIITHEHSDHIAGLERFSTRHKIPVYANAGTAEFLNRIERIENFKTGTSFNIGAIEVSPFRVIHDATDPVGLVLRAEGLKFVIATDLGKVTPLVRDAISFANVLIFESNHDPDMLMACSYPWALKKRISSTHGHLSNPAAAEAIADAMHPELLHLVLGHLSENSNTPEIALRTVRNSAMLDGLLTFHAASVRTSTALIEVGERPVSCNKSESGLKKGPIKGEQNDPAICQARNDKPLDGPVTL